MKRISLFLALSLFALLSVADDAAMKKFKDYTPQQIEKLSEKVRHSELPMSYTFAAQTGLSKDSELLFGMWLNSLMYPGVSDYKAAVKQFQVDLKDDPTGVLTVWQIHNLELRSGMQKLSNILFPNQFSSWKKDGYASTQGTMTLLDEKIAWPINRVKLSCYKSEGYCELDQLQIQVPNEESWSMNYQLLESEREIYNITKWTEDIVEAEPSDTANNCRTTSVSLNFKTKEFYLITKNGSRDCEIMGTKFEHLKKPRIAQIVDGKKIIQEEFSKVSRAAYNYLSSDFRKKVDPN